jgi:hypothetical protein
MCVIIQRQPNVEIPFDKIASACVVNPDGWGFAIADRGKLSIVRGLDKETDPEMIMKILEDAKDQPLMLHLRYVTQGLRTLENCHPFWSLTREKHGIDLAFCHNGTLWDWKEEGDLSDSYWLNQRLVIPLFERVKAYVKDDNILRDEFAIDLLHSTAGVSSLFGLIDGNGVQLAVNGLKGKEYEGWWASNEYSFNDRHRTPKTSSNHSTTGAVSTESVQSDWEKMVEDNDKGTPLHKVFVYINGMPYYQFFNDAGDLMHTEKVSPIAVPDDDPPEDGVPEDTEEEIAEMAELLDQGDDIKKVFDMHHKKMNPELVRQCIKQTRPSFVDIAKIDDLREVTRLDPQDIEEMCQYYPEATATLVMDLLYELYFKGLAGQKAAAAAKAAENLAKRKNEKAA